jgi:hypothetical protein
MTLKEFLNHPIFVLPAKSEKYFPAHLSTNFEVYLSLISGIDDENQEFVSRLMGDISNSCKQIMLITNCYFEGKLLTSYDLFSKLFSHLEEYLVQRNKNVVRTDLDSHLFKARSKLEKDFEIKDMFHIPFENRYATKTNRFSVSGLPCLYLANSVYTCWEELDRPLFYQMAVSRFETYQKNFKYMDLAVDLWFLQWLFGHETSNVGPNIVKDAGFMALEKFLQLFPLYLACYTEVYNKHADFKPEYIFPQMLMEWVVNSDWIDGIMYESTKTSRLKRLGGFPNPKDALNFAIPVRSQSETGFCSIISKNLRLTKPTSWELLSILKPNLAAKAIDLKNDIIGKVPVPPILSLNVQSEENLNYHETIFGRFEYYLFNQPAVELG